ncbi:MAG: RluA family pseudouridine synthase [Chlamydiia bacterium]|nr:RluA family pseudouridine synthase [Chlamydiia bacterium]
MEIDSFFIGPDDLACRLDQLLAQRFPVYSRTYFQTLIENGFVLVNGEKVKKRVVPEEGDEIEICFQALPGSSIEPEDIPLDILFEDEHVLAIHKPAGMVVHPAPGHWTGTFVHALLAHCEGTMPGDDPLRPGIVHRLDKETSGVLIAAKTLLAHQKLIEQFASRQVEKTYLAICTGRPANGTIQAPIGRHPVHRKQMAVLSDGREAITEIQLLAYNETHSLVLVKPKTGRTHQIRVHLKHIGCPVVGDSLYSNSHQADRHMLHAYRLAFNHPIKQHRILITAPFPEDFKSWMKRLCGPSLCASNL